MTDSIVDESRAPQAPDLVPGSRLLRLTLLSVVVAAFGVLLSWWLGGAQMSHSAPSALGPEHAPNTLEQGMIRSGGRAIELKASQKQRLSSYGWVDRKAGVAHIPIERAMEIRAQEAR